MVRFSICLMVLVLPSISWARSEEDIQRTLALQQALLSAREHLRTGHYAEAIDILEKQLTNANGQESYLKLLKEAYTQQLKQLRLTRNDPTQIEKIENQLKLLEKPSALTRSLAKEKQPTPKPMIEERIAFQPQIVESSNTLAEALQAFHQKKYAQANQLFQQLSQEGTELHADEKQAWGYCKLYLIATQLKENKQVSGGNIEQEIQQGIQLGAGKLDDWGQQLLESVRKNRPKPTTTEEIKVVDNWQMIENTNFRVLYRQNKEFAHEVSRVAEEARKAMFDRWDGSDGGKWAVRCDIYLHINSEGYAQITQQSPSSPGHSTVGLKNGKAVQRRIDLRLDDTELLTISLPHEVTYVLLYDLFGDQILPRWAEVAMTVLAEHPTQVARYLRTAPKLAKDRRLLPVGKLLNMEDYPDPEWITPFYVESVSLVDYLVQQKGPKAFAMFLREAPRRGFDKALQTHYGFKDSNELQEKWLSQLSAR